MWPNQKRETIDERLDHILNLRKQVYQCGYDFYSKNYGISNLVSLSLTISTGQCALRTTLSATLPIRTCGNPVRPWLPIIIRSMLSFLAVLIISTNAFPSHTSVLIFVTFFIFLAILFNLSSASFSFSLLFLEELFEVSCSVRPHEESPPHVTDKALS